MKRFLAAAGYALMLSAGAAPLAAYAVTAEQPESGGWRTFAQCFSQAVPGGRPMCSARGTNRDPSPRIRYIVSTPDGSVGRATFTQVIRCFLKGDDTTTSRARVVDLSKGQFVYEFRPYLVEKPNGPRRAKYCSVTVIGAEPVRGDGEIAVFMEGQTP